MTICGSLPTPSVTIGEGQEDSGGPPAIIWDWDDTILPSTFLADGKSDSTYLDDSLMSLQETVVKVLSRAIVLAGPYVFILTSSSPGWVHESCQLYLPQVVPLLAKVTILHSKEYCRELSVISRKFRRLYFSEDKGLKSTKLATVLSIVPTLKPMPRRVVLVGDQYEDVAIAQALRQGGVEARTCLFAAAPTPNELRRELQWLLNGKTLDRLLVDDALPQSDFTLKRNRPARPSGTIQRTTAASSPSPAASCAASNLSLADVLGVDPKIGPMVLGLSAYFVPAGSLRQCGRCRTPLAVKAKT
ncbi:hypothetical protein FOZ63_028298 [Perkinsus olseni]|uniref:Uncharacterized protein n=1 Tax=Perkinsus olseni TaxID=32597 RepID=A0A7J6NX25_PEROL|nr:hypothetical protein FOZ60_002776 [Perkinsus olseni]KAF4752721.1 hypothetical protein FOZ63_028298 [Perkinsus olseni]